VSGERGGFAVDGLDPQETQLRAGMSPSDAEFGLSDRAARLVTADGERPVELERGRYSAFYEGVVPWLRGGAAPPVSPGDAVAGLWVLDAARRSAAERSVIRL
jgi:predicted dehydrogenase